MPTEKSAGAVIFRKEKGKIFYLLLHYRARHWDLSKGHIENGEKPQDAALREIEEETGIKNVRFISGFKETAKYFYKRDGKSILKIVIFFLAETKTKRVKISYEHQGFKWLPYEKALEQLTYDNAKNVLRKTAGYWEVLPPSRYGGGRTSTNLKDRVYNIVKKIPKGKILTYKDVARLAGSPKAFRAVGNILNKNYDPKIPCHRVIRSDGKIGGYNRGPRKRASLLRDEGAI